MTLGVAADGWRAPLPQAAPGAAGRRRLKAHDVVAGVAAVERLGNTDPVRQDLVIELVAVLAKQVCMLQAES